jgi:hypothetical protein
MKILWDFSNTSTSHQFSPAIESESTSFVEAEVKRLRESVSKFLNEIVKGPGGSPILLEDPSGNLVELIQPQMKE